LNEAVGLLETLGLTPTLVALDVMEKSADVRVIQCELNDFYGVCTKITGTASAVTTAIEAGRQWAEHMGGRPVVRMILRSDAEAMKAIVSPCEHNPLIQQDVVFFPTDASAADQPLGAEKGLAMDQDALLALGLIETQGFTAVFQAIDTACKAADVEVVGKEKLGGGYVTIVIRGQLAAVTTAVEAGKAQVEGLGKLIAAHVIARPSPAVLALLPRI
jgi:microcompartment protein CcmL/EutN